MLQLDRLARSVLGEHGHRPFDELFPYLWAFRGERVDYHVPVSARPRSVLERWRGPTWDVYLWETPLSILARHGCGRVTLGELLWVAEMRGTVAIRQRRRRPAGRRAVSCRISRSG